MPTASFSSSSNQSLPTKNLWESWTSILRMHRETRIASLAERLAGLMREVRTASRPALGIHVSRRAVSDDGVSGTAVLARSCKDLCAGEGMKFYLDSPTGRMRLRCNCWLNSKFGEEQELLCCQQGHGQAAGGRHGWEWRRRAVTKLGG